MPWDVIGPWPRRAASAPPFSTPLLHRQVLYVVLAASLVALAAAAVYVAWASRGDSCRALAASRSTLATGQAQQRVDKHMKEPGTVTCPTCHFFLSLFLSAPQALLGHAHEHLTAPFRPATTLISRRVNTDVLEPSARLLFMLTNAFVRAAAVDIAVAIALQRAVDAAGRVPGTFFDALKRAFDGVVMEPAARFLAELDATCCVRGFVRSN